MNTAFIPFFLLVWYIKYSVAYSDIDIRDEVKEIRILLEKQNAKIKVLENENEVLKREVGELKETVAKFSEHISKQDDESVTGTESQNLPKEIERRLLLPNTDAPSPVPVSPVAFYAYMSANEVAPSNHFTLKFDVVKTNVGNAYNKHSGTFVAPETGIYVFTYTIYSHVHGAIWLNIFVNEDIFGGSISDTQDANDYDSETTTIVASLNNGDSVNIRTTLASTAKVLSSGQAKTSFSGWKIGRLLLPNTDAHSPVPVSPVTFYAYMSTSETNPSNHYTLKFDVVKTNVGNAYNKHSGTFVAPETGIYVFTYTIYSHVHGAIWLNIFVNEDIFGGSISDTQDTTDYDSETTTIVASLNNGDSVNVRTTVASTAGVLSSAQAKTSFSGWKIGGL